MSSLKDIYFFLLISYLVIHEALVAYVAIRDQHEDREFLLLRSLARACAMLYY